MIAAGQSLSRAERLAGALLGQALGDALGFVVEAEPPEVASSYVRDVLLAGLAGDRGHPSYPFGQYTDDTQLSRELLLSVREARGWNPPVFAGRIAELVRSGLDVGAGEGTRAAALRLASGVSWRESGTPPPYAGNGSAMRAPPLGVLFGQSVDAMCRAAAEQSWITHRDPRCSAGAVAVAGAIRLATSPGTLEPRVFLEELATWVEPEDGSMAAAVRRIFGWLGQAPAEAAESLRLARLDPNYADTWRGISAFVVPSVVWSLYSFLRSPDDYWQAVCTAIAAGGDTDTTAGMTGSMVGARVGPKGLPANLVPRVSDRGRWQAAELEALAHECAHLVP
ncbi:MAG TPA: ADP-ribosylglycohydrolase family protein [Gemmatimonadales bacterium]|nr:ADP-ribosylglycohydrolase family protein [Gemmatimonadales bacterium]